MGTAFARACKVLEIGNLYFHDMRHEAACAPSTFSPGLWTTWRDVSRIKTPLARSTPAICIAPLVGRFFLRHRRARTWRFEKCIHHDTYAPENLGRSIA